MDEKNSLSDFIEMLGVEDDKNDSKPLDFFNFYAAYNIKFPNAPETVFVINKFNAVTNEVAISIFQSILQPKEENKLSDIGLKISQIVIDF